MLLALGVVPVGLRDWYGDYPQGVWPWAQPALGDQSPTKLASELDFEAIAALNPDLILGLYIGLTQDDYATLSQIAPTVAQSGDHANYATPWQEMTLTAGLSLGCRVEAKALIASADERIASIRAEHPEFEGVQLVYAGMAEGSQIYVETAESTRVAILTSLGFVVPDEINALATDSFYAEISSEQLHLLDRDLVFWELGAAEGTRAAIVEPRLPVAGGRARRPGRVRGRSRYRRRTRPCRRAQHPLLPRHDRPEAGRSHRRQPRHFI